jgi:hypothetical protein
MIVVLYLLVLGLVARWVIAAVQAGPARGDLAARDAEILRLREEVDALHAEVRRLADEQSFTLRLLGEGGPPRRSLPRERQDPNPEMP